MEGFLHYYVWELLVFVDWLEFLFAVSLCVLVCVCVFQIYASTQELCSEFQSYTYSWQHSISAYSIIQNKQAKEKKMRERQNGRKEGQKETWVRSQSFKPVPLLFPGPIFGTGAWNI